MAAKNPGFQWRRLISYLLFFSFFVAALSGLALYLRPEGSLARWMGWHFFGLDKKSWEAVHTVSVLLVFAAAVVHNWYNRRVLWDTFRRLPEKLWSAKREVLAAFFLVLLFSLAALKHWPPVSYLGVWRSSIKNGERSIEIIPPVPDAERLPLNKLAEKGGLSLETWMSRLRRLGLNDVSAASTLEDLARKSNRTPQQLYLFLTAE